MKVENGIILFGGLVEGEGHDDGMRIMGRKHMEVKGRPKPIDTYFPF